MGAERNEQLTPAEALRDYVGAFVAALASAGVRHACIAPGSRSTPLAMMLQREPAIRVWMHLDERSAAYFGLGIAKALREPVALVCTSGTAAVNFAPAVAEAMYDHVPLVVLTADRPPELHDVGANQTIDQQRLYGTHVKSFTQMALPNAAPPAIGQVTATARDAVATALAAPAGPVHLNCPFREPLIPAPGSPAFQEGAPPQAPDGTDAAAEPDAGLVERLARELVAVERGLIVCGPQDDDTFAAAVAGLAEALGFPLLADPLSQVRCGRHDTSLVVDGYDAFLRDAAMATALSPQLVLRFGAAPVSKPLLTYLEANGDRRQIHAGVAPNDPALTGNENIAADAAAFCRALAAALPSPAAAHELAGWAQAWLHTSERATAALLGRVAEESALSEPGAIVDVLSALPDRATLFAGNSMPVRDLDTCLTHSGPDVHFMANRGVSGIDGVMSTGLGVAAVSHEPLVLVIGDLSFYHDMNGLLAAQRYDMNVTIVLVNNDGGGIFSFLPQAAGLTTDGAQAGFETLFGTPHGLDFAPAAELYGLPYRHAETRDGFREAIAGSLAEPGVQIVELRTEREANARLHRELWSAAATAAAKVIEEPEAVSP